MCFFKRFAAASQSFIDLNQGKFDDFDRHTFAALEVGDGDSLRFEERIMIFRLIANRCYLFEDLGGLHSVYQRALEESAETHSDFAHAYLSAIKCQYQFMVGEYKEANETATIAVSQFEKLGITGLVGSVDIYHVIARCLVEFARGDEAEVLYQQISEIAKATKQWHWFCTAEGYKARRLAKKKQGPAALSVINELRSTVREFYFQHHLDLLIDYSELSVRYLTQDWNSVDKLLQRLPISRFTENIRLASLLESGKRGSLDDLSHLPDQTPIDLIFKHLNMAEKFLDSESKAIGYMKEAMKIGSTVGAKEIFLQQGPSLGNLVIKVAIENPSGYNEDLAREMAQRIKEREMDKVKSNHSLTRRELEILRHLTTGRTLTVIASELHISQNTMKTHLKNLYRKLSASDRDDAVNIAKELSLL